MQADMLKRNTDFCRANIHDVKTLADIDAFYNGGGFGFCRIDSDVSLKDAEGFKKLKGDHSVSHRCMPFENEGKKVLIGKSY
jgi:hypothetical protein